MAAARESRPDGAAVDSVRSVVPAIGMPRLPLLPDPLRRISVPSDLEALTTIGAEHVRWAVMRRIGAEAPKSDSSALAFPATT